MKSRRAQNTDDYETWVEGGVSPTLNAFDNGNDTRATVVVFSHTQGLDAQPSEIASPTLRLNGSGMAVATQEPIVFPSTFSNSNATDDGISPTITVGSTIGVPSPPAIATETIVRRLTPTECERLMGWPDNHTLYRADGKTNSDSTRYKMCGNGVATPVANWIANQLKDLL